MVVTHGAIGANHLLYLALVEPGDRVVSVVPTYQQHYSIPESLGADVRLLRLREENGFLPSLDELRALAGDSAKLIAITNPNNPTGALMDGAFLERVVEIADAAGAYLLCDEVYRGTDQEDPGITPSVADLYCRGISTGSMSKAFSLAGLRLGWIAAPPGVIHAVSIHRDYNTISVSMVDDLLASIALENKDDHPPAEPAHRSRQPRHPRSVGVRRAARELRQTALRHHRAAQIRLRRPVLGPLRATRRADTGVMLTPGSAFDMEGHLRIGYANNPDVLKEGLSRMSRFFAEAAR